MITRAACFAAALCASASFAAEITLEQAKAAVGNWIAQGGGFGKFSGGVVVSGETLEDSSAGVKMHLVRISGKGFVITPADDGIEPILLFSDGAGGGFAAVDGDPVWDMLRWDVAARISSLATRRPEDAGDEETAAVPSPQERWAALLPAKNPVRMLKAAAPRIACPWDVRRAPLLKTCWNQTEGGGGSVYNLYTPEVVAVTNIQENEAVPVPEGWIRDTPVTNMLGRCPAGCVAVAGGQLMKYWASPRAALPEKDVMCTVFGKPKQLRFHGAQVLDGVRQQGYMWESMGVAVPHNGTANEFVSRLLSDIGIACGASYDATATAMSLYNLAKELKSTFGYRSATYHTGNRSGAGLREVLMPNLDAGCPVIVGIGSSHAAVVDGYGFEEGETTFYMHVNLGWGYSSHYWYSPPNIEKYSTIDEMVCNVSPSATGQADG